MHSSSQAPGAPVVRPPPANRRNDGRSGTDRWLLFLLVFLNIGSAWTTVSGAREVLPRPMSDVIGLTVQLMLLLTLAGFAARHAPVRKWFVVGVLSVASVYTSFFAYYARLAGEADASAAYDRAVQAHAGFVSEVYQPTLTAITTLEQEASELYALSRKEGRSGLTTGVVGFGPVARKYAEQASTKEVEAARLKADLQRLQDRYEYDVDGMSPDQIYQADLTAWQLSPDTWKAAAPQPERGTYLDLEQEVKLLTPFHKIRRGEAPAIAALLLALLVDGVAILLGTAIHSRGRPAVESAARTTVDWIHQAKDANAAIQAAWRRPGVIEDSPVDARVQLDDALRVVILRIQGRGSDFLTAVYQAIHPESGALDYAALQGHPNGSYRVAARMLVDRLRGPKLGWVEVSDGFWTVPQDQYARLTNWLTEHIRQEAEVEAELARDEIEQGECTLRLVLPAA